ncbi:MAG: hypothetical protein KDM64_02750 [Verrucomicrobiae bacterium]|nr:hypothetical protein [Verrucomicrobiae bacterium]
MTGTASAVEKAPESLIPPISGACLAVRRRLGPGRTRESIVSELLGELKRLGLSEVRARNFQRRHWRTGHFGAAEVDCFDLVVQSRAVIEFAHPESPDDAFQQLSAFEDRLNRMGWTEGLMVDFDETNPIEGMWIARSPGDLFCPSRVERLGIN